MELSVYVMHVINDAWLIAIASEEAAEFSIVHGPENCMVVALKGVETQDRY